MNVGIRDARDDDGDGVIALIDASWSDYPGCVLDVDGELPELRTIASHFRSLGGRFWVAEREGIIVGCVGVIPVEAADGFELHKLYVAQSERRHGLGRRLVRLVEDESIAGGSRYVELWTDTRFVEAHRFYERLGYTRLPQIRTLNDISNSVEYRYRKALYLNVNVT